MSEYNGPTVFEMASRRIHQIDLEMCRLREERKACIRRTQMKGSHTMSEAERAATAAEPFQTVQLPEWKGEE